MGTKADAGAAGAKGRVPRKDTPLSVPRRPELARGLRLHWQQFAALNKKNMLMRGRAWRTNLLIVVQAVLFVLLTWAVDKGVTASRQRQPAFRSEAQARVTAIGPIPDCSDSLFLRQGEPCYTVLYAPQGVAAVEAVMAQVAAANKPPIPPHHMRGFANASEIDAYLLAHLETVLASVVFTFEEGQQPAPAAAASAPPRSNTTGAGGLPQGAIGFSVAPTTNGPMRPGYSGPVTPTNMAAAGNGSTAQLALAAAPALTRVGFVLQTNSSVQWFKGQYQDPNTYIQIPLQSAVERELVRYLAARPALGWEVALAQFPHPASHSASMVGQFAPTFLFASIMFQFVLLVHDVVAEKESGVRRVMTTMGLAALPYWASWALFQGLLAVLEACLLVGFSYAFGFELFTDNAFGLSFLLLLLVSLAMTSFGFFVAAFLRRASAAVPAGFVLFVFAWVLLIVIAFGFPYSTNYSTVAVAVFSSLPWTLLAKGIADLAAASAGRLSGLTWGERFSYCHANLPSPAQQAVLQAEARYWQPNCVMPLGQIYWVLAIQTAAYFGLSRYLDAVLPDGNGVKCPPWFFLQPSFWLPSKKCNLRAAQQALAKPPEWEEGLLVDPDVQREAEKMRARCLRFLAAGGSAGSGLDVLDDLDASSAAVSACCTRSEQAEANGGSRKGTAGCSRSGSSGSSGSTVVQLEARCTLAKGSGMGPAAGTAGSQPPSRTSSSSSSSSSSSNTAGGAAGPRQGLRGGSGRAVAPLEVEKGQAAEDSPLSVGARRYAVEMYGIRKEYRRGGLAACLRRRKPFVAVRNTWLGIYEGECFCLLGPNGAGKSTTIHCMTGVQALSAGEALVYGESIASPLGMDRVRPLMGVCPQFDVLFDNLTGREHLNLFAAIKGLPGRGRAEEAAALLEEVRLTEAGDVRAGAYSGGMKRRLSVAIALLGDPKIVYLDECTTGMDPVSRRHVWDLIHRVKAGRVIVLTTHSMEEADCLGDRIGIMARGRLRCVGTSLRLKARFGSGYRISVRVQGADASPTVTNWSRHQGELSPMAAGPSAAQPGPDRAGSFAATCEILPEPDTQPAAASGGGSSGCPAADAAGGLGAQPAVCQPQPFSFAAPGGGSKGRPAEDWQAKGHSDALAARQIDGLKAVFWDRLGVKAADEAQDYVHFLVPYENEDKLPMLLSYLRAHSWELGIADIQLRLTPLEEVFLNVARKAELEHAQAEGRFEMVTLPEEGVAVKVPIGAELIQSPSGALYHIRWVQDAEIGELKLQDLWQDPISAVLEGGEEGASRKSSSASASTSRGDGEAV